MLVADGTDDIYPIGQEFATHLGNATRDVYAEIFGSLSDLIKNGTLEDTWLYKKLPPLGRLKFKANPDAHNFLYALISLAEKMFGPRPAAPACRSEEMLLWWIIERMEVFGDADTSILENGRDFLDHVLADTDFLFLYDPKYDGIEDFEQLAIGSLDPDHWFLPYYGKADTHPLTWPEQIEFRHEKWKGFKYPK